MSAIKLIVFIVISLFASLTFYTLTSNLWFFKKDNKIVGSKDSVISKILQLVYSCYEKNINVKASVICERITIASNEDISAIEILSRLDKRKIEEDNVLVEDLSSNSRIIIRYENGKIFVEEEKYEVISS